MLGHLSASIRLVLLGTVFLGLAYPLAMAGIGKVLFPTQASGSLIRLNGHVVGARMIGQSFTSPQFFQGRPSATSPAYNPSSSSASNFGPTNPALLAEVRTNLAQVLKANPGIKPSQVPISLVESSDSGVDPDITPQSAMIQVPRVARVNHLSVATVRQLVVSHERGRFLGIFGDPYVNVLELNLALYHLAHHP